MLSLTSSMRATSRERGRVFRTAALLIAALRVAACAGHPAQAPIAVLDA